MGRRYTTAEYAHCVQLLRQAFPDCSVTTDLIVGFPGESEAEFTETLDFLEQCAFAGVHVFPYSARQGTRAASLPGQLSQREKAARAAHAKQTAARLGEAYRSRFIGRRLQALPEHRSGGLWAAHGQYGFPIYIEGPGAAKNRPVEVEVRGLVRDGVIAVIVS